MSGVSGGLKLKALMHRALTSEELDRLGVTWPENVECVTTEGRSESEVLDLFEEIDCYTGLPTLEMLKRAKRLKLVNVPGHGIDFTLAPEYRSLAIEKGITFCKLQPADIPIAEYCIGVMIAISRRLFKFHEALAYRADIMRDLRTRLRNEARGELYGSTLGIIGFGSIAKALAERARAFHMTLGAVARRPERIETERYGISFTGTLDDYATFLPRCDYVVLTLPNTPETAGCFGAPQFAAMKNGAYLVNIARGTLIDNEALYAALIEGKLGGAALDVWDPPVKSHKTATYPFPHGIHHLNVIMTPHYSGGAGGNADRVQRAAIENIGRLARGEPLMNVADLVAGY